ncbi:MAG: phenylalanine--tRNA ligase subunit beta [Candidatus Omnitrophota bacterium]|nr:MAG: phenylalanine--tRNA ligase subunit beta [Candidatus Omnitrophota bacterium]
MRFSLNFVKELLPLDVSAQELASRLTMAGMEVEFLARAGKDWVFDVEVTTNRYDWLSVVGITREIAACLHKKANIKYPKVVKRPILKERKVIIEDLKDCPLYIGRQIEDLKVKNSPAWLRERVFHCGIATINNVVDITNYCMLKWGNPLHAFDADKLEGNIYIRRAKKGEIFIGIDERERKLCRENLVIADDKKVIALAGVMGAKNSEVSENTKNVFLEAAIFSPLTVRRSRRAAGIDTESSYRFERKVHPDYLEYASVESSRLMQELGGGRFTGYAEAGKKPIIKSKKLTVDLKRFADYLGEEISSTQIKKILTNLDFEILKSQKDKISVLPSRFRFDFEDEVDVYEEIVRIYGYDRIAPCIPFLVPRDESSFSVSEPGFLYRFKNELRTFMASLGLREIITYSIEADQELANLGQKDFILLLNPLRAQENAMRTSLLLGMIKSIRNNLNRNQKDLRFFEIANIYSHQKESFIEKPVLAIGLSGQANTLFCLKGLVEEIFKYLNIEGMDLRPEPQAHLSNALGIYINSEKAGLLGKLDEKTKKDFDLKQDLLFAQLQVGVLKEKRKEIAYRSYSLYPAVSRDISIALRRDKKFAKIRAAVERKAGEFLVDMRIVDEYRGKDISSDYHAFTLRVFYQSKDRTLTSSEVDALHTGIREDLHTQEGIILR